MSQTGVLLDRDQFSCSICLDLLKDPVTIPCGHSYCMGCIKDCWDQDDHTGVYSCPQCRQSFTPRPTLYKNIVFAEMVEKLKKTGLQAAPPAGPGDMACDVCTGRKLKAIKSCLVCLASYCETHLKLHNELHPGNTHNLINATRNLQKNICSHHDKLLEIYCRTDQQCICYLCLMDEHRGHDTVSAAAERTEKQKELGETQRKFQQRIQEREKELQDLRQAVQSLKRSAQAAVEDSERIFTELICSIERRRSEVKELIRDQEKAASCQSVCAPPGPGDLPSITVNPHLSFEAVGKSVSELKDRMEDVFKRTLVNISQTVVEKLKKTGLQAAPPAHCYAGPGDVACDFCTGRKLKAVKSCLKCLASYCETHLQPHYESPAFKKHKLVQATGHLQEKICSHHDKLLEVYCRTDQRCICYLCTMDEHRGHDTVSAAAERTEKQKKLGVTQRKFQQRIQEREKELQDLRQAVQSLTRSAQAAVEDSERIFTELICSIERRRSEVKELIRDQEKAAVSRAEGLLERLEQEIAELRRRDAELEQLSHTEDHIHFLQSCQSVCAPPGPGDSPSITVNPHLSFEAVRKSVSQLKVQLEDFCKEELVKISQTVKEVHIVEPRTREDFLQSVSLSVPLLDLQTYPESLSIRDSFLNL
ncbi:hypothetical protein JZ751_005328 [Albula glossodonta]|uniref:Uncharacterized protein n=1 Tax=Albula glossodonta TaxID=121402 RepID=A0A8T2MPA2_9TELE|nr:hypothetical protein JZ751_005328 [Albula glossodonta]